MPKSSAVMGSPDLLDATTIRPSLMLGHISIEIPLAHVVQVIGKCKHCHTFTSNCNIKASFPREAFFCGRLANSDCSQETIVDIKYTFPEYQHVVSKVKPCNAIRVDIQPSKTRNFFLGQLVRV